MNSVSSYILTIAGVVLISVVVELALPDGQMSKYIKSIFSFFIIGVIIAPLPSLLSSKNVSSIFDYSEYQIQDGYIYSLNTSKLNTLEIEEEKFLMEEGYANVDIEITAEDLNVAELVVKNIYVNFDNLIIEDFALHKDIDEIKIYLENRYMDKFDLLQGSVIYD